MTTKEMLLLAKQCSNNNDPIDTETKNRAIELMAAEIDVSVDSILAENLKDLSDAQGKLSESILDRLKLNKDRIKSMTDGMRQVAALPDPVGRVISEVRRDNGLVIAKKTCPIGVIGIIYESRPNVTSL